MLKINGVMNVGFMWVYRENIGNIKGKLLDIKNRGDRIRKYAPNPYNPHKYYNLLNLLQISWAYMDKIFEVISL